MSFRTIALAVGLTVFGASAQAASLGLPTSAPTIGASGTVDYLEFGSDGDLSLFGAAVDVSSLTSVDVATAELDFGVGFDLADPLADASGGFSVTDQFGTYLAGDLWYVGSRPLGVARSVIEFQFGNLTGRGAGEWTQTALMNVIFSDLGSDPFAGFVDGGFHDVEIGVFAVVGTYDDPTLDPAPVPLPAAGWMLFAAAALLAALRRGRHEIS